MKNLSQPAVRSENIVIREIVENDFDAVRELLCEGFPQRRSGYWYSALQRLSMRPLVEDYPQFGYFLTVDGRPSGVLLLLTALIDGVPQSNLSSWYVRERCRKFSVFMFQQAIKRKGGLYVNLSPSAVALPIATAFGFTSYTTGSFLVHPGAFFARTEAKAQIYDLARIALLPDILQRNIGYGCQPLWVTDFAGSFPALYRIEYIKKIPAARFVYGDPARLLTAAPAILRLLLRQGLPLLLFDAPPSLIPQPWVSLLRDRARRYYKGEKPPEVGNLLETELAVFGV